MMDLKRSREPWCINVGDHQFVVLFSSVIWQRSSNFIIWIGLPFRSIIKGARRTWRNAIIKNNDIARNDTSKFDRWKFEMKTGHQFPSKISQHHLCLFYTFTNAIIQSTLTGLWTYFETEPMACDEMPVKSFLAVAVISFSGAKPFQ